MSEYKTVAEEKFLASYPRSQMLTEDVIYHLEQAISAVRRDHYFTAKSRIERSGVAMAELVSEVRDNPKIDPPK